MLTWFLVYLIVGLVLAEGALRTKRQQGLAMSGWSYQIVVVLWPLILLTVLLQK